LCASAPRRRAGVTLFEMVIAIAVLGIALAGVLSVFITTTRQSADPMVQQQAQFLAEAYLEEILLKKFYDPDDGEVCPPTVEASRQFYDNVCDFNGLVNNPPQDQFGTEPPGLAAYTVSVTVDSATQNLNGLTNSSVVLRIDVTVTGPNGVSIRLSGYRTNYNCSTGAEPGCRAL
jgi:MSHA pilin protein MshD